MIARNIFAPLYYQLAQQILDRTGSESGFCLDLGSGSGYLGLALAWNSKLRVCLLNESSEMTKFAEQNIFQKMLENRVTAACGDVHCLPFEDSSVDLVVSHGSVYFWNDLPQVFREIWRVLAPGGQTFISDGFGSREVHNEVIDKMRKIEPDWHPQCHNFDDTLFDAALAAAKIRGSLVLRNENGIWIRFRKSANGFHSRLENNFIPSRTHK
ncbi:class I SAM-dependent methyltransferase [Trichlorobacter lovleyi]|uniref:Methyltransferase type 11 n=1 Tax=Trichlorobacter lovleyi (strain ATCC BAA-1151 / DSM 17278 / SZ) TaxID=398767 RepID=B3E7M5_TRIL1|nr:class I SAM-dependent methyltransferase [Trichlorobacter lovleyi]ACD95007.1 Methyltransferase type 11 [Trichlorobacter lovleyi SZ]